MEISKFITVVVAVIVLYSVEATAQEGNMACIEKLMPCQPYIRKVNPPPPASCCGPLKEILEKDAPCLCTFFNNPGILKNFNITKEHALDLPKACGINPDVSLCAKNASAPTASPGPANGTSSASTVSFKRFSFLSAFVALIFF